MASESDSYNSQLYKKKLVLKLCKELLKLYILKKKNSCTYHKIEKHHKLVNND